MIYQYRIAAWYMFFVRITRVVGSSLLAEILYVSPSCPEIRILQRFCLSPARDVPPAAFYRVSVSERAVPLSTPQGKLSNGCFKRDSRAQGVKSQT